VWIAQLELSSILHSIAYQKRDDRTGALYLARCASAVREAALHPQPVYERVVAVVQRALAARNIGLFIGGRPFQWPTFAEARSRVLAGARRGCSVDDEDFFVAG
jgi:hypothetical protein